jgi:hypothetical protein
MVWSLNLDIPGALSICGFISLILTLIVYYRRLHFGAASRTRFSVMVLTFLHFWSTITGLLYIFVFKQQYDIIFIVISSLIIIQWYVINDCILSYYEKLWINSSYVIGSNALSHPYTDDMFSSDIHRSMFYFIERMLGAFIYVYVIMRYGTRTLPKRYHLLVLLLSVIILITAFCSNLDMLEGTKQTMV